MPPKKVLKLDTKQQTLVNFWRPDTGGHDDSLDLSASVNEEKEQPSASVRDVSQPKKREFLTKWLSMYSWLRFVERTDTHDNFMYCSICDENNAKNSMVQQMHNRNYQNTTLVRHAGHPDHVNAVRVVPQMKQSLAVALQKGSSDKDKAIEVMFKTLEWMIKEDLPLSKFQSLVQLLHDFNVKDLEILTTQC